MPKLFLILFLIFIIVYLYNTDIFEYPVESVEVTSTMEDYDKTNFDEIITSLYGSDLLSLDINQIRKLIASDKWIKDVEISKSFPSKLKVVIIQHQPYAIYNSKLLMVDGTIIASDSIPNDLPIIIDNTDDTQSSQDIFELSSNYLSKINLKINKIEIFNSLIRIHTSHSTLISDRQNFEINLNRLVKSYYNLKSLFRDEIKSIDMRYYNGFAIK